MSEREYAVGAGLERGAIQKAKTSGRFALHPGGSIGHGGEEGLNAMINNWRCVIAALRS